MGIYKCVSYLSRLWLIPTDEDIIIVGTNRAVSPIISVILMVAIAVILTATISIFVLGFTEDLNDTAPVVGQTSGEFEPGSDSDQQLVRITHVAGDNVDVENIEIVVRASGPDVNTEARLVNLPGDGRTTRSLDDSNIEGNNDLIDQSYQSARIIVVEDSNTWTAGDTIEFRIRVTTADFRDSPDYDDANELRITVVYTDTESTAILFEETFRP